MWLYVPFPCAPESEDSISQSTSHWEALSQSVTSNGNSPQPRSLRSAWKRGAFNPLQFGAISQRSMDAACEAWWMSLRQDSRARITVTPGSGPDDSAGTGRSGTTLRRRFATWNPQSSSWRTWPESEPLIAMDTQDSGTFSETWPRAGTMRSGCAYERPTWERRTTGNGGSASRGSQRMAVFPTPSARDAKGENHVRHLAVARGRKHMDQLPNFIAHSDSSPQRLIDSQNGQKSSSDTPTSVRRLNPAFVSWLMGFPWWWTHPEPLSFAPSATQLYLCKLRSLCASFCGDPASSFRE